MGPRRSSGTARVHLRRNRGPQDEPRLARRRAPLRPDAVLAGQLELALPGVARAGPGHSGLRRLALQAGRRARARALRGAPRSWALLAGSRAGARGSRLRGVHHQRVVSVFHDGGERRAAPAPYPGPPEARRDGSLTPVPGQSTFQLYIVIYRWTSPAASKR